MKFNINFTIPLRPISQMRPKFVRKTGRVYDPCYLEKKKYISWIKRNILNISKSQFNSQNYREKYNFKDQDNFMYLFSDKNSGEIEIKTQDKIDKISDLFPISQPLRCDMIFSFSYFKTYFKANGDLKSKFVNATPKNDLDNVIKFTWDVMQDANLIQNDKLFTHVYAYKQFSNDPNIWIRLYSR